MPIWLDRHVQPLRIYQFWLNTADADVIDRLKVFTFLTRAEIEEVAVSVAERPVRPRRSAEARLRSDRAGPRC